MLRERFSQHKNSVKKRSLRTLLVKHFNEKEHSVCYMTVKVLEKIYVNVEWDKDYSSGGFLDENFSVCASVWPQR